MSRTQGKASSTPPAEVYLFRPGRRGVPRVWETSALATNTDLKQIEYPTEAFYVPDFLEQFQETPAVGPGKDRPISVPPVPKRRPSGKRRKQGAKGGRPRASGVRLAVRAESEDQVAEARPKLSPDEQRALCLRGRRLMEQGDLRGAREIFEGMLGAGTVDSFPYTMLGTIALAEGRLRRAEPLFDAALSRNPADLAARVYRGEVLLARGRIRRAVEDLTFALRKGKARDPFVQRAIQLIEQAKEVVHARWPAA